MISIEFDSPAHPSRPLQRGSDSRFGVDANFRIADADGAIFQEPLFGVVELRSALETWLDSGAGAHEQGRETRRGGGDALRRRGRRRSIGPGPRPVGMK